MKYILNKQRNHYSAKRNTITIYIASLKRNLRFSSFFTMMLHCEKHSINLFDCKYCALVAVTNVPVSSAMPKGCMLHANYLSCDHTNAVQNCDLHEDP